MKPLTPSDFSEMHLRRIYETREISTPDPESHDAPTDLKSLVSYFEGTGSYYFESYITTLQEYQLKSLQERLDKAFESVARSIKNDLPDLQNGILEAKAQQCQKRRSMAMAFAISAFLACVILFSLPRLFRTEFDASVRQLDDTLNRSIAAIFSMTDSKDLRAVSTNVTSILTAIAKAQDGIRQLKESAETIQSSVSQTEQSVKGFARTNEAGGKMGVSLDPNKMTREQATNLLRDISLITASAKSGATNLLTGVNQIKSTLSDASYFVGALKTLSDTAETFSSTLKQFQTSVSDEISTLKSQVTLTSGPVLYLLVALIGMLITLAVSNYIHSIKEIDAANLEAMQLIRLRLYSSLMSTLIASKVPNENAITLLRMFMDRRDSNAHLGSFMPLGKTIEQLIDTLKKR